MGIDWSAIGYWTLLITGFGLLLSVNAAGVFMVALQLPGTWVILLATAIAAWVRWDAGTFGWWTLVSLLVLAVVGEVVEFLGGMVGAKAAGAGRRAGWLALAGGIVGAIAGTFLIPIAIVGTLAGAGLGAAIGSITGDLWEGRHWKPALHGGGGAAVGRITGTVGKLTIACLMWLLVLFALIF